MKTISIHSKKKDYKVIIDAVLSNLLLKELDKNSKYYVVLDEKLEDYYDFLKQNFPKAIVKTVKGGEDVKSLIQYNQILCDMLANNISKEDTLLAFGGGTITDLVGYIASTYKRGINYINVPTTTLSMIDASIGGKNALNINEVKNAVGTIYPPEKVIIGIDVLNSLDKRNYNNGLFEALKMGILFDEKLFNIFKRQKQIKQIEKVITKSIMLKKAVVQKDEECNSTRNFLNFGHTIGHALESYTGFDLKHGEAVANGMLIVSKASSYIKDLEDILNKMKCPLLTKISNGEEIISFIKNDKKIIGNSINMIIVNEIGKPIIESVSFKNVKGMLNDYGF